MVTSSTYQLCLNGPLTPLAASLDAVVHMVMYSAPTHHLDAWMDWMATFFTPLAHLSPTCALTPSNNGPFHSFGKCGLSLDTIMHMAMSLNVVHIAASEDRTACTPQPHPKT